MTAADSQPDLSAARGATGSKWLFRGVLAAFALVLLLPFLSVAIYGWRVNQQRALLEEIDQAKGVYVYEAEVDLDEQPWIVRRLGKEWAMPRAERIVLGNPRAPDVAAKLQSIGSLALVDSLDVSRGPGDDSDLSSIAQLKSLKSLDLTATDITDAGIRSLLELRRLDNLDLSATNISDEALQTIAQLPSLTSMRLRNTAVSQAAVDKLRQARPELEIAYVPAESREQVTVVREIFKRGGYVVAPGSEPAETLFINGAKSIGDWTGFDWSKLGVLPELKSLIISEIDSGDQVIAAVSDRKHLRTIRVSRSPINARFMTLLGECDQLEIVWIDVEEFPAGWTHEIEKLENLKDLLLVHARIGRSDLAAIATLTKLKSLQISKSKFDPGSLEAFALPPALERLDLFSCNLTDDDVKQVARCQSVKELSLIGNRDVTDQSIDVLLSMPSLERAVVGATGFSEEGEQRLTEALQQRRSNL
jgi:internalin A